MKLFILLFLFIVITCHAHQSPLRRRQIARNEYPEPTLNEQIYEKFKMLAKKYMGELDPLIQTLLAPAINNVDHLRASDPYKRPPGPLANNHVYNPTMSQQYSNPTSSRFNNPAFLTRSLIDKPTERLEVAQIDQTEADREARLAQADKVALSKLSEEDRKLLENSLTLSEREALLVQLEDGKLDDLFTHEENRFGVSSISSAAAKIASSAGSYIGSKFAGELGAQVGAAAGAYLGAAAVSGLVKKIQWFTGGDDEIINPTQNEYTYGDSTYGFGAYNV